MDQRQPLPIWAFLSFEILLSLPLTLNQGQRTRFAIFLVLCLLYHTIITATTGTPSGDWSLGLAITPQLLKALDVFVLNRAEDCFRRRDALHTDPASLGFFKKLVWATELMHTPRGVNWNWEVPYICYIGTQSRRAYLYSRVPRIVIYYLVLDFLCNYIPTTGSQPIPADHPFSAATMIPVWSYAVSVYLHLWLVQTIPATLLVGSGISAASSFPYVMGPVGAMASLRCFWGRTFHQAVRRQITSIGHQVCWGLLHADAGGLISRYGQLAIGFAIGGMTHAVGGYMAAAGSKGTFLAGVPAALLFFGLQFCGVVMEDIAYAVYRTVTGRADWREGHMDGGKENYGRDLQWWRFDRIGMILGYFTVVIWFTVTLPPYVEDLRRMGILDSRLAPVAIFSAE